MNADDVDDYWWRQRYDDALFARTGRLPGEPDPTGPGRPSRLLVTGSRNFSDAALMAESLLSAIDDYSLGLEVVVVHGNARGADRVADAAARKLGLLEPEPHDAKWNDPCRPTCRPGHRRPSPDGGTFCPAAGNYRNQAMVDLGADVMVAFPLGASTGTRDAMRRARQAGIPVREIEPGAKR